MKIFLYLLFFMCFGLFLYNGCTKKEGNYNELIKFEHITDTLRAQAVEDITVYTNRNVYLTVADTFLVVAQGREPFIHVYSTNTHAQLAAFGRKGKGPGEFIDATLLNQVSRDSDTNAPLLKIHDFKQSKVTTVNVHDAVNGETIFPQRRLPNVGSYLVHLHHINDNFFIATPHSGGNLLIYDFNTATFTTVPYLPKLTFDVPKHSLYHIYRPAVYFNKNANTIAAAPYCLGELDFFDMEGNLTQASIFEPRDRYQDELENGNFSKDSNLKYYIVELEVAEGLIYGLNHNRAIKDYENEIVDNKLQVFNWKGQAVKEYPLDDFYIFSFAIDEVHNRIYGYAPDEEEHNIVIYNLK
ncbi:MAG: hypothetical protein FH748_05640 [Balneolaceae bacterium]|nr:hypothetical protein [Balneolaceae bacterium]